MQYDIQERTFNFSVHIVNLCAQLSAMAAGRINGKQLLRSGTSIGADIEEADAAYSRREFTYRMNIALGEARETHYWLRLIQASIVPRHAGLEGLLQEAEELKKIIGKIVRVSRAHQV